MLFRTFTVTFIILLSQASAQKIPNSFAKASPMYVEKTTGRLTAVLDTFTGRFSIRTLDARNILFYREGGVTSYINVKLGARTYTSNGAPGMGTPVGTRSLGMGKVAILPDRLRYEWEVTFHEGSWHVTQELIPTSENEVNEVAVEVTIENRGSETRAAQIAIIEDLEVDGNDAVLPECDGRTYTKQRMIVPLPERWIVRKFPESNGSIYSELRQQGIPAPQRFIVGHWAQNGYVGGATFDFIPDSIRIRDSAVLTEWSEQQLPPGGRTTTRSSIGLQFERRDSFMRSMLIPGSVISGGGGVYEGAGTLTFLSDTVAHVEVTLEDDSGIYYQNFVTVQPRNPTILDIHTQILVSLNRYIYLGEDSTCYYNLPLNIKSDRDVSIIASGSKDVTTILPLRNEMTSYVWSGVFCQGTFYIVTDVDQNATTLKSTFHGGRYVKGCSLNLNPVPNCSIYPGNSYAKSLSKNTTTHINVLLVNSRARNVPLEYYPFEFPDGSGSLFDSFAPCAVFVAGLSRIINVPWPQNPKLNFQNSIEQLLPNAMLGTDYLVIPFRRPTARVKGDFIRILATEDSTELRMNGIPFPRALNKFGFIDTLVSIPIEISSTKRVAVYQYSTHFLYAQSDSLGGIAMSAVLAEQQWRKKYYCVQDIFTKVPHDLNRDAQDSIFLIQVNYLVNKPSDEYITIVCKRGEESFITIDGVAMNPAIFISTGRYSYAVLNDFKRLRIIESKKPIFVQMYGWKAIFAYAYIPPFR